jgi:hypothetical protein
MAYASGSCGVLWRSCRSTVFRIRAKTEPRTQRVVVLVTSIAAWGVSSTTKSRMNENLLDIRSRLNNVTGFVTTTGQYVNDHQSAPCLAGLIVEDTI